MFFDDHKKALTIVMGKRDGKGERTMSPTSMKAESVHSEDGEPDGMHAAMQEFMAAHSEKSPMKMAQALSNFLAIHHAENGKGDPKPQEEPEGY